MKWEHYFMGVAFAALVLFMLYEFRKSAKPVEPSSEPATPYGATQRFPATLAIGPVLTLRQDEYKVEPCDCEVNGNG